MKKELTKAVLAAVLGFFAVACASDASDALVEPVTSDSELVEIQLNGGVSLAATPDAKTASSFADGEALPDTRAVIDQKHGEVALAFARVNATAAGFGTSAAYPAWSSTTAGEVKCLNAKLAANTSSEAKAITFATPQYYLANAYYTKLVGWAPSVASDSDGNTFSGTASTFSAGTVTCPIDGATDIMLSQELEGNKEAEHQISTSNSKTFAFNHQLTQIKVSAYAADEAGKTQWGAITAIKVQGEANKECKIELPNTVTYGLKTGASTDDLSLIYRKADGDATISMPLTLYYDGEANPPASGFKQECGYAMFAPVKANSENKATITLLVSTQGGPDGKAVTDWKVPVTVSSADGFKAGKVYAITLKFTAQPIGVSGTVAEWSDYDWTTDAGGFNGEITL